MVLLPGSFLQAQAPIGTFQFNLSRTNAAGLWDLTGGYELQEQIAGLQTQVSLQLTQDFRGLIEGTGSIDFSDASKNLEGAATVRGNIFRRGRKTKVNLTLVSLGRGISGIHPATFRSTLRFSLELDEAGRLLSGPVRGDLRVHGERMIPIRQNISIDIPANAQIDWTLRLELSPGKVIRRNYNYLGSGQRMHARGSINLTHGSTFPLRGSGYYSQIGLELLGQDGDEYGEKVEFQLLAGPDETRIHLKGQAPVRSWRLHLRADGPNFDLWFMSGRIMGQSFLVNFPRRSASSEPR